MVYGGGLGWRQEKKKMKTIFRMNGLFQGTSRKKRERGSEIEKGRRGRRQERGVLHDFKLTIIVGFDMYYVSRGCES